MLLDKGTPIIKITEKASARVQDIINNASSEVIGLRIGIKTAGCSGMKYHVEYAKEINKNSRKFYWSIKRPLFIKSSQNLVRFEDTTHF